ncbi:MAG TPA: MATE family efflux transporter [Beijerinckiaceae bacterium]|jgi:putative MATE family efflux protein
MDIPSPVAPPQPVTAPVSSAAPAAGETARFVTGSPLRHVAVMTGTGAVGLVAVFVVDFLSLLYVSWLGDPSLTAGVGFATVVLFFGVSINIGLMIAAGALVSRALGAGDRPLARRLAASSLVHLVIVALAISLLMLAFLPLILGRLGATGEAYAVAERFLWITLPSNALMALGMGYSGVLRAVGDAARAMYVTLIGGLVTAGLDPLLIFGLGLGTDGAAWATVGSRLVFALVGLHGAVRVHDLVARPSVADVVADARAVYRIGFPAVLTNVAPALANAFLAGILARFGDAIVAGGSIIDRLVPVVFGGIFALSGAVGPILGQNWGAGRFDRMRETLRASVLFMTIYTGVVWALLLLAEGLILRLFQITGPTAHLVSFFCWVSGALWFFNGLLFVANASFNNLGFPLYSTAFNWGRATLGTIPFALVGAWLAGPEGALAGTGVGSLVFGCAAIATAFWTITKLAREDGRARV